MAEMEEQRRFSVGARDEPFAVALGPAEAPAAQRPGELRSARAAQHAAVADFHPPDRLADRVAG
jgi:hypothetical protein